MNEIAVIVPVYNGADLLEECANSIKRAGNRISEIIIVDDGSVDETLVVAEKLSEADQRIKVISTENHGSYMARKIGISAASSRYIAFIDVDDRYYNGCLDFLADLIEENNCDVAMGQIIETDDLEEIRIPNKKGIVKVKVSTADQMWPRIMKWKTQEFVCYINKLYKKELLLDLIDAERICQGDDVLLTCQAFLNAKKILETDFPMYIYYQNPKSLTHVKFGDRDLDLICVWDQIVEIMRDKNPDLVFMAQFNRWRTDFTLITRLILADDRELDKLYADNLFEWREGLKTHWKDLISTHAMPLNRELLIIGFRFFYPLTKCMMRVLNRLFKEY